MSVKISTAKHPGDPTTGDCAYQVTDMRMAMIRQDSFEIQDAHGGLLGSGTIGFPKSDGTYCTFATVVPGIAPANAY